MEIEAGGGSDNQAGAGDIERGVMIRGGGGNGYMVWEELSVIKPISKGGEPKIVLNGLTGFAEPFRIMAVMGPSGSGKSTLLDALSGRLSKNVVMTGNILLHGKKRRLDYGVVAYITQEDVLLGTLTVRETITYSANLRLPTTLTKQEMEDIVDGTIMEMGLEDCADRVVGNWHRRGISGGEKRRLSIALEILTRPQILFLDEPTSGLDSASAFFVVQALRSIAGDGRIVISSIHQPSSEVFALFDDLYLLSGGETVFFGEANLAVKFFAEAGFPCPSRRNPSDHFLRSVNSDFDAVLATLKEARKTSNSSLDTPVVEIKRVLIERYKQSTYGKKARARVKEINDNYEGMGKEEVNYGNQTGWLKQLRTLTKRSFVNMTRDIGYYWLRLAIYIAVSICVGSLYFDIGNGYTSIMARGACSGFMSGFMIFMSIGGFPNFIEEMKVFYRERLNGHYGVGVFIVSNFVASFPFLAAISTTVAILTYFMVRYHRGIFPHLIYHVLSLFGCISAIESCMMVIASLVPNFMMGVVTGAGIIGIMMLTSGFYRFLADLPKVFWRYPISYINFLSWAFQGAIKELLVGEEFEPLIPGNPMVKGEDVVKNMFKIPLDHSQWWDLAAILISVLFYRLIFFAILKFKETASPFLQSVYSKRALKNLDSKKTNNKSSQQPLVIGTSKRHNTPLPLSSQEGLNSPMHS